MNYFNVGKLSRGIFLAVCGGWGWQAAFGDSSELLERAAGFPAMPRGTADLIAFQEGPGLPTYASGAPFNDLQFTLLDTDYMDGENNGFDTFLPVDPADPVPGADRVKYVRCALNTDLDVLYGGARGDRILLGTAEGGAPFFRRGPNGIDDDYLVIQHFDFVNGFIQLPGIASDYEVVYGTRSDGCATEGWYLFYVADGEPDLIAFIFPCHDLEPAVSGNPPQITDPYCNASHALDLLDPAQFRYAEPVSTRPAVPGGIAQFGGPGKDILGGLAVDETNHVYLVGSGDSNLAEGNEAAENELFIAKLGPDGRRVWATEIAVGEGTMLKAAAVDGSHVYVAGRTLGALPGFKNAGKWDGILLKLDRNTGAILATDQWGNAGIDGYGNLILDGRGNLYVSAQGSPPGPAGNDDAYLVAKHRTADLTVVWRVIDSIQTNGFAASAEAWGGLTLDPGETAAQDRLIVAGWYFANQGADAFLTVYENLDQAAPTRAHNSLLSADGPRSEWILDTAVDAFGRIYVGGYTSGNLEGTARGEGDAFVARYGPDLSAPVFRQFGTARNELVRKLFIDSGTLYAVGYTYGDLGGPNADPDGRTGDVFVQTFDTQLQPLAVRQFGTPEEDRALASLLNGNLFIAGMTEGAMVSGSAGGFDAYVLALDPARLELFSELPQGSTAGSEIEIVGDAIRLSFPAEPGGINQIYTSSDLLEWDPLGDPIETPFGHRRIETDVRFEDLDDPGRAFFKSEGLP